MGKTMHQELLELQLLGEKTIAVISSALPFQKDVVERYCYLVNSRMQQQKNGYNKPIIRAVRRRLCGWFRARFGEYTPRLEPIRE